MPPCQPAVLYSSCFPLFVPRRKSHGSSGGFQRSISQLGTSTFFIVLHRMSPGSEMGKCKTKNKCCFLYEKLGSLLWNYQQLKVSQRNISFRVSPQTIWSIFGSYLDIYVVVQNRHQKVLRPLKRAEQQSGSFWVSSSNCSVHVEAYFSLGSVTIGNVAVLMDGI